MQRYRCRTRVPRGTSRIVEAAKIAEVQDQTIRFEGETVFRPTTQEWRGRFHWTPDDLGYFIRYADGYESWVSCQVIEDGYEALVDDPVEERPAATKKKRSRRQHRSRR